MYRNFSRDSKRSNRLSESISKRNYSANIIKKMKYERQFKGIPQSNYTKKNNILENNNEMEPPKGQNGGIFKGTASARQNPTPNMNGNLEKFLYLNQQFKENDLRKKNLGLNRKITSAEPNVLKTKISQNLEKLLKSKESKKDKDFNDATSDKGSFQMNKMKATNRGKNFFKLDKEPQNLSNISEKIYQGNSIPLNPINKKVNIPMQIGKDTQGSNYLNIKNFNYVFMGSQSVNKNKSQFGNNTLVKGAIMPVGNDTLHNTYKVPGYKGIHIPPINSNSNNMNTVSLKDKFQDKEKEIKPYLEYYVHLTQNARETMEDFHLINEQFNNKPNQSLFALFDGHGGVDVAKKIKDELSQRFSKLLSSYNKDGLISSPTIIENNIKTLFKKLDDDITKQFATNEKFESTNFVSPGSTCTMLYLNKTEYEHVLYCANVGDTRGILVSKTGHTRITYEHKPSDDFENKRIKSNGGVIFGGRIFGQFSLTRAFGNIPLKKWVIADPFIKKINITENDKYAVIASDGIWEVISDEECNNICLEHTSAKSICEELVNTAIARWSKDNISCIVVKLS